MRSCCNVFARQSDCLASSLTGSTRSCLPAVSRSLTTVSCRRRTFCSACRRALCLGHCCTFCTQRNYLMSSLDVDSRFKAASNVGPYGLFWQPALVRHYHRYVCSLIWANKDACLLLLIRLASQLLSTSCRHAWWT